MVTPRYGAFARQAYTEKTPYLEPIPHGFARIADA
jgi:hypothetical protein